VIVLESLTPGDKNSQTQNAVRSVPVVAVMCGEESDTVVHATLGNSHSKSSSSSNENSHRAGLYHH